MIKRIINWFRRRRTKAEQATALMFLEERRQAYYSKQERLRATRDFYDVTTSKERLREIIKQYPEVLG